MKLAFLVMKLEGLLQRLIRRSVGHGFLLTCGGLSLVGTFTAIFPVTAVVIPAALLQPTRWRALTLSCALGSALGATLLVATFHQLGWETLYASFPELAAHPHWQAVMDWAATYGTAALFVIAATPLPQTPALIFFGAARSDFMPVFGVMLAGKLLKYGLMAWLASRFPQRFAKGLRGVLRRP